MASQVKELGLGDYVDLVMRRWRWIVGATVIGTALVAAFTFTRDEVYQSRADVLVLTERSEGQFTFDPKIEERLVRSSIAELQLMAAQKYQVATEATIGYEPTLSYRLLPSANANKPEDSSVIRIESFESSAERAQVSAQTFAMTFVELRTEEEASALERNLEQARILQDDLQDRRTELRQPISDLRLERSTTLDPVRRQQLDEQIAVAESEVSGPVSSLNSQINSVAAEITELDQAIVLLRNGSSASEIINNAFLPANPLAPNVPRNLILGFILSMILGLLLATVRELLDSGTSDATELATLSDTPIIATIPRLRSSRGRPGGVAPFAELSDDQSSPYRALLDSVWLSGNGQRVHSVAVTGVRIGLGSTQTAVNMAQAEARRGVGVCLVDADFAAPTVTDRLDIEASDLGLADLLADRCMLDDAIVESDIDNLDVIGAGLVDRSTPDHLRSQRLGDLLESLGKRYELVVVDTSPVSGLVDSRTVASQCDGVVVVYDETRSKRDDVVNAVEVLRSAHARPVGLVANRSANRQQIHLADA